MKAILIDDEPDCLAVLAHQLAAHCPEVQVLSAVSSTTLALKDIRRLQPDIVFTDIEMPQMNGFQLLDEVGDMPFALIFTTAYDQFAVKAFTYAALGYLLKPIDPAELVVAVNRAAQQQRTDQRQLQVLKQYLSQTGTDQAQPLALPTSGGYRIIEARNITYCESEGSYTRVFLVQGESHLLTRILGDIEGTLLGGSFFRTHKSWLVNLHHVRQFIKGEGAHVIMSDGKSIPIARNRREDFARLIRWL
ncbi:MAG: LytTR family DNA-binding domain-containing protein [Bacteroidia bacterium]|nr:LytTR family DNA-binding domain-containing protein [Bacteroidia bacterium]